MGGPGYALEDLGRPAEFLLPEEKLGMPVNGKTVLAGLENFLAENFGAYTTYAAKSYGVWRNHERIVFHDRCRRFEVSFVGKDRIPLLLAKLAEIAWVIGEECIYFKAGQYATLIFPKVSAS
ncbi:MAG: hypothetical protein AAB495_01595 [Patescibacteria group bacterium]